MDLKLIRVFLDQDQVRLFSAQIDAMDTKSGLSSQLAALFQNYMRNPASEPLAFIEPFASVASSIDA
jgi:hypothetical protein